jgi:uncharacterized linocin/CFP29 family protein
LSDGVAEEMNMIDRFLDRDSVALSEAQWDRLQEVVVDTARRALVGRRFIPIYGPLGAGIQSVPKHELTGTHEGVADFTGEAECGTVRTSGARFLPLPIIHKDFLLLWRNAAAEDAGVPLDLAPAASASTFTARKEDDLIFNGDTELGLDGILTVDGRHVLPLSDWREVGSAFGDVTAALERLGTEGFYGPYALIVPPSLYAQMHGVHERTGVLEIRNVEELTTTGVFRSAVIPEDKAAVVAVGAQNMDLAIAQDMVVAALGPEKMNLLLRVFEVLALRIKRPQAIVTLEGAAGAAKRQRRR